MRAAPAAHRRARGFSLLELIVVACLVGIFATVALDRLLRYLEIAEKTAMEAQLGALRSALAMQAADRITRSGLGAVAALAKENPVDWLATPPQGYLGALHSPPVADVPKGSWYFDLGDGVLVYRPQQTRFFAPGPNGGELIRFRAIVRLAGETADRSPNELAELTIRPVAPVRWSPEF